MMIKKFFHIIVFLLIFLPINVGASDFSLEKVSQYGKGDLYYKNIILDGDYLYTYNNERKRLEIIDISEVDDFRLSNYQDFGSYSGWIEIDKERDLLFISLGESIEVYDIISGNQLSHRATIDDSHLNEDEEYKKLKLYKGNYLLVSAINGLKIFDVANLDNILLSGNYQMGIKREHGCLIEFDILNHRYLLSSRIEGFCWPHERDDWGNYVIDLFEVDDPSFVRNIDVAKRRIVTKGDYGYTFEVHHDGEDKSSWYDEIVFYNLADIHNIKEMRRIKLQQGDVTAIDGVGIWDDKFLYYIRGSELTIFDITNPAGPDLILKEFDFLDNFGMILTALMKSTTDKDYIYLALARNGLVVLDYKLGSVAQSDFIYPNNSLIKGDRKPAIYIIQNGKKRQINSPIIFENNNFDWSKVIEIPQEKIDEISRGDDLIYKDGKVLRDRKSGEVYAVSHSKKHRIDSLKALKRFKFSNIIDVSQSELRRYEEGRPLTTGDRYPDGVLLKRVGKSAVYYIENGKKHPIVSAAAFEAYGHRWDEIIMVSQEELKKYPLGEMLYFPVGSLIKAYNKSAVYVVNNHSQVRPFMSAAVFEKLGYKWPWIYEAPDRVLQYYQIAKPIN